MLTVVLLLTVAVPSVRIYTIPTLLILTVSPLPRSRLAMKCGEWIMLHAAHYFGLSLVATTDLSGLESGSIVTLEVRPFLFCFVVVFQQARFVRFIYH